MDYISFKDALARFLPGSGAVAKWPQAISEAEQARALQAAGVSRQVRGSLGGIYLGRSGSELDGVVYIDHVIGRTEYMTYGLAIDPHGRVRDLVVMTYREPIGSEVRKTVFVDQFLGRTADETLRLKKEIKNIAGATLSCRGVCQRVRFLLALHRQSVQPGLAAWLAAQPAAPARQTVTGPNERSALIGTALLRISGLPAAAAEAALRQAQTINEGWSAWAQTGALQSLHQAGHTAVDDGLRRVLQLAIDLARQTGGAFDPTVRPLLDCWWQGHRLGRRPSPAELAKAGKLVDWQQLRCEADGAHLPKGMRLDLGGLRKGAVVDAVAAGLTADGPVLVDFGGSSLKAVGGATTVTILNPAGGEAVWASVALADGQALAVSGGKRRSWQVAGERLSTIIDPRSGQPAPVDHAAAVLAPQAALADGLATAACLLVPEQLVSLIKDQPAVGVLLQRGGETHRLGAWPADP